MPQIKQAKRIFDTSKSHPASEFKPERKNSASKKSSRQQLSTKAFNTWRNTQNEGGIIYNI